MARPVSLRLRHPRGALQLNGLDPATTLEALRALIAQRLELPPTASFHQSLVVQEDATAVPAPTPAPAPVSKPAPVAPPAPAPAPKSEPAPAQAKPAAPAKAVEPLVVGNDEEGYLVRRVVDSDNSCLFTSIGFVLENHDRSRATTQKLRKVIADAVRGNEEDYSEAVLGKAPAAYCDWIQRPESWGGAIELAIFAKHYRTEIAAFDLTTARHQVFGVDGGYAQRVLLMYDGIHYDPLALSFGRDLPEDLDQTIFALTDTASLAKATAMCQALHQKRQFTNTGNFTLRCGICQEGFTGEKAAVEHAQKTGHTNFSEFK